MVIVATSSEVSDNLGFAPDHVPELIATKATFTDLKCKNTMMTYAEATASTSTRTVTFAQLQGGILSSSGDNYSLTLPTATLLTTGFGDCIAGDSFDFSVIAASAHTVTVVAGDGTTSVGNLVVSASTTGRFKLVYVTATSYKLYRLS